MKAIVQRQYGTPDVLEFCDVDQPVPGAGEVLVRVRASSVNPADWFTLTGRPYVLRLVFGLRRPKREIAGKDVAGTVEAVGPGVTRFAAGDDVYGELSDGAYAEYVVVKENALARKPATVDFPDAAAVPLAGITALQGMRDAAGVTAGKRVLVNGASGGVGVFAVQIAKALGAHVTGVCSTRNADLVRSAGADEIVDYTREDFTRADARYDVVFDLVGNHTMSAYRRVLNRDGVYVSSTGMPGGAVLGPLPYLLRVLLSSLRGGPKMRVLTTKSTVEDLGILAGMVDAGQVKPIVERAYTLAELADALAHQGRGHARGKTVVTV